MLQLAAPLIPTSTKRGGKAEAAEKRSAARKLVDDAVRRAYQHVVYLGRGDGGDSSALGDRACA